MTADNLRPGHERVGRPATSILATVFTIALALRWTYAGALYAWMGTDVFVGGDSPKYLGLAEEIVQKLSAGGIHGWDWLGADAARMPMYIWLLAANLLVAGKLAPLTVVLCQGLIDAATCLIVYAIAAAMSPRVALAAGIAASINPTQIVLSGLVYTDTLFAFFTALSLLGAVRWLNSPSRQSAVVIALALGAAALTRVFVVLWTPALLLFLLAAEVAHRRFQRRHLGELAIVAVIVVISIAPLFARNITQYGTWALTPQGGNHLVHWVVPLVQEAHNGSPWATGTTQMEAQFRKRYPEPDPNPFVESRRYSEFGREMLAKLGLPAIAKAWLVGAAINLGAPAAVIAPPVAQLPRTGFYDTKAASALEKIRDFLFRSDNALYAWILLIGIAGVSLFHLFELIGFASMLSKHPAVAPALLLGLWIGFILAISGPVASPKYRLPIEPALMVFAGAGYEVMRRWLCGGRRSGALQADA